MGEESITVERSMFPVIYAPGCGQKVRRAPENRARFRYAEGVTVRHRLSKAFDRHRECRTRPDRSPAGFFGQRSGFGLVFCPAFPMGKQSIIDLYSASVESFLDVE